MIKIQNKNLNKLVENHFEAIKEYFDRTNTKIVTPQDYKYINRWIKNKTQNRWSFEKVIKAKPRDLKEFIILLGTNKLKKKYAEKLKKLYESFASSSGNFKTGGEKYNAFELVKLLEITVCPYCNRNFIYNADKKRTSELDHFFDKDTYPILAVSFYNLIPSCKTCNQTFKGSKEISVNPYDMTTNLKFGFKIKNADFYHSEKGFELDFEDIKQKLDKNFTVLGLEDLYNNHKDIVLDLIQKSVVYNDSYVEELFSTYEGTFFKNKEDVLRLITSNYITEEELEKRPLAKLTKDISEELGLI